MDKAWIERQVRKLCIESGALEKHADTAAAQCAAMYGTGQYVTVNKLVREQLNKAIKMSKADKAKEAKNATR